jgi:integrase
MPRPRKDEPIDFGAAHDLSAGLLERATCPAGRPFVLLRDTDKKGLRLRVTQAGGKHWQFETRLRSGKLFTRALGEWPAVSIGEAQAEAHRLRGLTEKGTDPRELEREAVEAKAASDAEKAAQEAAAAVERTAAALTVGEAWTRYLAKRRPHWGERTYADHLSMADPGGKTRKRMPGAVTKPGPLAPLMPMRLAELDADALEAWAESEAAVRPARLRLALRLLKAFLRWAGSEGDLRRFVDSGAASAKGVREVAGAAQTRDDCLLREQLSVWFEHVQAIGSPVISAYLQTLLLTGARPGEVLALRWDDLNVRWRGMSIRDKVEGERQIPLTPYVWSLLSALPRRNAWVFSSTRTLSLDEKHAVRRARYHAARGQEAPDGAVAQSSESGRIAEPGAVHRRACAAAGLDGLTLHGLRRSFASLTEWLEVPVGVVAQIQGHKPSATAEKHYKRRPLDLLRVHHERIEAWILKQAGVEFDPEKAAPAGLRAVQSA